MNHRRTLFAKLIEILEVEVVVQNLFDNSRKYAVSGKTIPQDLLGWLKR